MIECFNALDRHGKYLVLKDSLKDQPYSYAKAERISLRTLTYLTTLTLPYLTLPEDRPLNLMPRYSYLLSNQSLLWVELLSQGS